MHKLVLAELRERQAQYARKAAETRARWATLDYGPMSLRLGRRARHLEQMAESYDKVIEAAEDSAAASGNG